MDVGAKFYIHESFPLVVLAFFSSRDADKSSLEYVIQSSNLSNDYKKYVLGRSLSKNGCSVFPFTDRDTWRSVGIVAVDMDKYTDVSSPAVDACVGDALRVVMGLPGSVLAGPRLDAKEEQGRLFLNAAFGCSSEGATDAKEPERSRDGLTALPSMACIKLRFEKLSAAQ